VSQQTTNRSFDDLARAMAEGSISRRRALKLFAGSAIAALIPSRALADDDDCVRVCHVPFDRETDECDFANARTICVSRRERRRHLENHPCDCQGRCANCLSPPAEPICNPPCSPPCRCRELADGTGTTVCTDCATSSCSFPLNNDCANCRPGTICVFNTDAGPGVRGCENPCQPV
jgi:hypothetical protein